MEQENLSIAYLRQTIIDDLFEALGESVQGLPRKLMTPFIWPPAHKFSQFAVNFDQLVKRYGSINDAMRQVLPSYTREVKVNGAENVPTEGPLLVVSNHPGAFDEFVIAASLPRNDLKIVASGYPFLHRLPATKQHLLFIDEGLHHRMSAVRQMIHSLEKRISLLIFPSGTVDPDPALIPGAEEALGNWSRSLELIIRRVPQTQVLVTIVSGVISPAVYNHPIPKFFRRIGKQQGVAQVIQIMQQMFIPKMFAISPRVSFERPFSIQDINSGDGMPGILHNIIERAKELLNKHTNPFGDCGTSL